jgi:hypothetical protein
MATKWIIGLITIYFAILLCTTIANNANQFTSAEVARIQHLMQPIGTDITSITSTNIIGQGVSMITNVWSYVVVFLESLFLWSPSLWTGSWLWFYYFFCIPLCISIAMTVVFALRGVHSS